MWVNVFGRKEYHLLLVMVDGVYFNTFIEGRIAKWMLQHKGKKVVVVNNWRVTRKEYLASLD